MGVEGQGEAMVRARFRVRGAGVCFRSPQGDLATVCGRWSGREGEERTQQETIPERAGARVSPAASITAIPAHAAMQPPQAPPNADGGPLRLRLSESSSANRLPKFLIPRSPAIISSFGRFGLTGIMVRSQEREELRFVSKIEPLSQLRT